MEKEYEVVRKSHFRYLNVFLVRMVSRTLHIHGELELGLILDGEVILELNAQRRLLKKDDIFLINPLDAHEFSAEENGALILSIQLSYRAVDSFLRNPVSLHFLNSSCLGDHFHDDPQQYAILRLLCLELAYHYLGATSNYEYRCFSLTAQLFHCLKEHIPYKILDNSESGSVLQKNDRILSVTRYVDQNFTQKLLLEDIAHREGVSMYYLSHLFKEALGISFQEYVKKLRFEYAYNLVVSTERSILDISISSGFSDVRYLNRLFQENFNCTPKEYRARNNRKQVMTIPSLTNTQYLFAQQDAFLLLTPIRNQLLKDLSDTRLHEFWAWTNIT